MLNQSLVSAGAKVTFIISCEIRNVWKAKKKVAKKKGNLVVLLFNKLLKTNLKVGVEAVLIFSPPTTGVKPKHQHHHQNRSYVN